MEGERERRSSFTSFLCIASCSVSLLGLISSASVEFLRWISLRGAEPIRSWEAPGLGEDFVRIIMAF